MKNTILVFLLIIPTLFMNAQESSEGNQKIENDEIIIKQHPILTSKIYFNAGLFLPSKTIKVQLNGSSDNEIIDFNDTFGFNANESTFAGNFAWRFAKKWHLGTEFFGIKNVASKTIEGDIEWEDVTYKAGANVEAGFKLNLYRIFIGRVITSGQKYELGIGLGVHTMDIRTYIQGEGYLDGSQVAGFEKKSFDVTAPLPNLGIWYYYGINEKWALIARVDWFGITVGEYSGSLWNIAPGVKYQISKHFGAGLNYRYFNTNLTVDKPNLNASIDVGFHGPLFTFTGNF